MKHSAPGATHRGQQTLVARPAQHARRAQRPAHSATRRSRRCKPSSDKIQTPANVPMSTPSATGVSGRPIYVRGCTQMHTDDARTQNRLFERRVQPPGAGLQPPQAGRRDGPPVRRCGRLVSIPKAQPLSLHRTGPSHTSGMSRRLGPGWRPRAVHRVARAGQLQHRYSTAAPMRRPPRLEIRACRAHDG